MSTIKEAFAQGMRCGHCEGWGRAGSYVIGEETLLADEAESNGNVDFHGPGEREAWRKGYANGYRFAAYGVPLPVEYQYPVERKGESWA